MRASLSYLVLATPRSGSGLLCQALESTNLAGQPKEYFGVRQRFWSRRWDVADPTAYIDRLLAERSTPNGVFGAKLLWRQLVMFDQAYRGQGGADGVSLPELFAGLFPNLKYVSITRRDKVRQAISYWKARQTGTWSRTAKDDAGLAKPVAFDYAGIDGLLRTVLEDEAGIAAFLRQAGARPISVVYEDFVESYRETVKAILDELGIAAPADLALSSPRTVRLADDETEAWVARFRQLKADQCEPLDVDSAG